MKRERRMVWLIFGIQLILIMTALFIFQIKDMRLLQGNIDEFGEGWTLIREDNSRINIEHVPYEGESEENERIVLTRKIPEKYWGKTLCFLSADKTIRVTIDRYEIYSFGMEDDRLFGKTPGSIMNYIDVPKHPTTGIMRIEMVSPYKNYAAKIDKMHIGDRSLIVVETIRANLMNIVLSLVMIFAGIVLGILAIIQKHSRQSTQGMEYLSPLCLIGGIYSMIETKVLILFFGNQTVLSMLIFFVLMNMPLLLQFYYEKNRPRDYKKRATFFITLCLVNIFGQIFFQVCNIADFMEMVLLSHLLIGATCLFVAGNYLGIFRKTKQKGHFLESLLVYFMLVGFIVDIVRNYTIKSGDMGLFSRYGIAAFCVGVVVINVARLSNRYTESISENAKYLEHEVEMVAKQNEELLAATKMAEEAKAEAVAANKAKSDYLASMSHEIRTPINAINGMNLMILRETKENSTRKYALDIQRAGKGLLSLVNDILDLSKIEAGKMEIIPVEYETVAMINDCYNMISMRAREKNLALCVECSEGLPSRLFGDEMRIRQVIINLLTNAVKYTKEGRILLNVSGTERTNDSLMLKVTVKDTGQGISEQDKEKLFQMFQRIDERKNSNIEGTGLGLNITKHFVELMDGTISVESEYGKGSVFTVEIPQKICSKEQIGKISTQVVDKKEEEDITYESFEAPNTTILVVDDVEMNRKVIGSLLKNTKMKIHMAESGMQCLALVEKYKYDIICMDHMMPGMDGVETLRRMKELKNNQNKHTPVIMLTANAVAGAKKSYLEEGFADYVSKPIRPKELEEKMLQFIPKEDIIIVTEEISKKPKDFLESLDFLDTKVGMSFCGDSEDIYRKVLENYARDDYVIDLREQFQKEDWEGYLVTLDSLYSSSESVGATELAKIALSMEKAVKREDIRFIIKHHKELMETYAEILKKLREIL